MATATKKAPAAKAAVAGVGRIARVTGPVVDIEFPHDSIPGIYNALKTTITIGSESTEITLERSEERRVGKECLRLCRSRWSPYH